jgi:hypothetical protein
VALLHAALTFYFSFLSFFCRLCIEITILLFRSALPVHPLCAAIQSIGIVKRDIEHRYQNNNRQQRHEQHGQHVNGHASLPSSYYGLGKAMLPAIVLHGTFDFVLFVLGFLSALYAGNNDGATANDGDDENDNNEATLNYAMRAWSSSPWTARMPFTGNADTAPFWSFRVTGNSYSYTKDDDDDATTNTETPLSSSLIAWMNTLSLFAGPVIFLLGIMYYCVESFRQRARLDAMDDDDAAARRQRLRLRNGTSSAQPL